MRTSYARRILDCAASVSKRLGQGNTLYSRQPDTVELCLSEPDGG